MKDFAALFARIDESTKTNVKLAALADYLGRATPQDRLWTIALFTGRRPKRAVTATRLRQWAAEVARLPEWLFEDSYHVVGDLAETISLVLPAPREPRDQSLSHWIATVKALATLVPEALGQGLGAAFVLYLAGAALLALVAYALAALSLTLARRRRGAA